METKNPRCILPVLSLILLITSIGSTTIAVTPAEIEQAIEDGISWLVTQQQVDGSWYDPGNYEPVACTGFSVTKLADRAFELAMEPNSNIDPELGPFDPNYIHKDVIESGLNFIFQNCSVVDIYNQPAGNPDTDGDANGVRFGDDYRTIYSTGICMMAIASTRAPDMVVNCPNSPVHGWTYKELLTDTVDFMAFAQTDYPNTGQGGWRYRGQDPDSDNSNTGYAVLGLAYAESCPYGFNCVVPQFVKDELKIYIDFIQCNPGDSGYYPSIDGSSGYEQPCDWPNILKNGNLIIEMTFAGISVADPNLDRALDYIERTWNDSSRDPGWGNPDNPHCQATFCAMRGLEYSDIDTIVVDGNERDWYADFADALVNAQQVDGSWPNDPYGGIVLATEWALLTLEKAAPCRMKITKFDDINDCVGPGDEINYTICYSYPGFEPCPDINIIDYLPNEVDFNEASDGGTYDSNSHTVIWHIGTVSPGDTNCFTLKVNVKECIDPSITITNEGEIIRGGEQVLDSAYEDTPVYCPILTKEDNVPDGSCVGHGDEIVYNICYAANGYGDTNVIITDELPNDVNFVSATGDYSQPDSNTVIWNIGTLEPNESNCVTLTVKVIGCVEPNSTITNCCEMTGDCITSPITACENTTVCGQPTLTKVDNLGDWEYSCLDGNITYSLCYSANGYGDTNVEIIDELPYEVNYVSSDPCGTYNEVSHKVTWDIPILGSDDSDCLELVVQVNTSAVPDTTITNQCRMTGDCINNLNINITATENTLICPICSPAGSYPSEVTADNPVLWLRFEDYPLVDSSGNDYWVNSGKWVPIEKIKASLGKAAYLNKNYVAAANQQTEPNFPTDYNDVYAFAPNDISFELWFKADADFYDEVAFFNQAETEDWAFYHYEPVSAPAAGSTYDGNMCAMTYPLPEEEWGWRYTDPNKCKWPTDGDWHHLVVTYDEHYGGNPTVLGVKMYLDANLVIDDANSGDGVVGPEMDHILIGSFREEYSGGSFKGYMDEFAIYPGVLSKCRVAAHYAAWQPKNCQEIRDRLLIWDVDRNQDCRIDFYDFAIFAEQWALCNEPGGGTGCAPNW